MSQPSASPLIEDRYSERAFAFFAGYARRLLGRSFTAVRAAGDTLEHGVATLRSHHGPVIVAMSHASWWDPLLGIVLHRLWAPHRMGLAPMDAAQLSRFAFFRRMGLFGVQPDDAASLNAMRAHVRARFDAHPRAALWITPQGRFTDPREPVEIRPGVAAIAADHPGCAALALAVEYPFWQEKRPEVLLRFEPVDMAGAAGSTASALRAIRDAMTRNGARLAALSIARDPAAFCTLIGGGSGRINPAYDAWLRLRGKGGAIEARRVPVAAHERRGAGAPGGAGEGLSAGGAA